MGGYTVTTGNWVEFVVVALPLVFCIFLAVYACFDYKSRRAEEAQRLAPESTTTAHAAGPPSREAAASAVAISVLDHVTFRREGGTSSPSSEEKDCAVCLAAVEDGEVFCVLPTCRHEFHRECVEKWLRTKKSSCPVCRAKVQWPCVPQSFAPPVGDDIV